MVKCLLMLDLIARNQGRQLTITHTALGAIAQKFQVQLPRPPRFLIPTTRMMAKCLLYTIHTQMATIS